MGYLKTIWTDRLVEKPNTFNVLENEDGTITLTPKEGKIFQEGTKINATNLNHIENMIGGLDSGVNTYTSLYNMLVDSKATNVLSPWTNVTPINGWTHQANNPCQYYIDSFRMIHFRGVLIPGTLANGVTPFVMPTGYRPITTIELITKMITNVLTYTTVIFESTGNCKVYDRYVGMTGLYFNNIHYELSYI